jgi:hypothetical protein
MKAGYTVTYNTKLDYHHQNVIECSNISQSNTVHFYHWFRFPGPDMHTVAIFKVKPKTK